MEPALLVTSALALLPKTFAGLASDQLNVIQFAAPG